MSESGDDREEELEQYVEYLQDRIQFLEQELEQSEKQVLELIQELDGQSGDGLINGIFEIESKIQGFNRQLAEDMKKLDRGEDTERIRRELEEWEEYEREKSWEE